MKPQTIPETDEPEISDAEILYRFCKTGNQVSQTEDGQYVLSTQIFSALGPGCSVEVRSLIERGGVSLVERAQKNGAFATVSISAGDVRKIRNKDGRGKETDPLKVAYTPIPEDQPHGPNPFHADIFPPPTGSANKELTKQCRQAIEIDQAQAEFHWKKKRGLL